jgi:hypothetical protein
MIFKFVDGPWDGKEIEANNWPEDKQAMTTLIIEGIIYKLVSSSIERVEYHAETL